MISIPATEDCRRCGTAVPQEWMPSVFCEKRALAGTGVWRSALVDGMCASCRDQLAEQAEARRKELTTRIRLIELGGGEKPYREFTFEKFRVMPGNERAYAAARRFYPKSDALYLWGACGVGKSHLAFAAVRGFCADGVSTEFIRPPKLLRRVRSRFAEEEQRAIDEFVRAEVFVLDDLGVGSDTAYARQIFQEVLDGREYQYRAGLIVTSRYSLDDLAQKLGDDAIVSRLAGMCTIVNITVADQRICRRGQSNVPAS